MTKHSLPLILFLLLACSEGESQTRAWDSVKVERAEKRVIQLFNMYDPDWDSATKKAFHKLDSALVKEMDQAMDAYFSWDMFYMKDAPFGPTWVSKSLIPYRTL
jgi:hypothetical protein